MEKHFRNVQEIRHIDFIPYSTEEEAQILLDKTHKHHQMLEYIESETSKLLEVSYTIDELVHSQQTMIDTIEETVRDTKNSTEKAEKELLLANKQQNLYRGRVIGATLGAIALGGTTIATFGLNLPLIVGTTVSGSLLGGYLGNSVIQ